MAQQEQNPNPKVESVTEVVTAALKSGSVPHFYVNGFRNVLATADVALLLEQNGVLQATLNMSHTTAKTLAVQLRDLLQTLESALERPLQTSYEIEALLKAGTAGRSKQ